MSMNFSTESAEEAVTIDSSQYILKEASVDAAKKYKNAVMACAKLGPGGKPSSLNNLADTEPYLVSLCLWTTDEKPSLVPLAVISTWPYRIIKALYDKCKELSDLGEPDSDRELLGKLLSDANAPCKLEDLHKYAATKAKDSIEFRKLVVWLQPTPEELAKNE